MTTRLYTHPLCVEHVTPPGHPERPDRMRALDEAFSDPRFDALERIEAPKGDPAFFELAHPKSFLKMVKDNIPEAGIAVVDADTSASPKSWEVVLHVCGAAMDAVDSVFAGDADNAFVSMRPPRPPCGENDRDGILPGEQHCHSSPLCTGKAWCGTGCHC